MRILYTRPNSSQATDDTNPDLTEGFKPIWTTDRLHPRHVPPSVSSSANYEGRLEGNGNNNNASGNQLYGNQNINITHMPGCQGRVSQSLLQPPEHAATQQGAPMSHTISNTTMSTVSIHL